MSIDTKHKKYTKERFMSMKNTFQFLKKASILLGIVLILASVVFASEMNNSSKITLDADDADLAYILSELAAQGGFNIVISSAVYEQGSKSNQQMGNVVLTAGNRKRFVLREKLFLST